MYMYTQQQKNVHIWSFMPVSLCSDMKDTRTHTKIHHATYAVTICSSFCSISTSSICALDVATIIHHPWYPLVITHGNGQSPMNGGVNRKNHL